MSKAENRAIEKYPIEMYEEVGWRCVDKNAAKREYFVEGYHQAEKDLDVVSWVKEVSGVKELSRAKEEALKAYPPQSIASNYDTINRRDAFEYGYLKAEKDLELTWDDIHAIAIIEDRLIHELCLNDQTLPHTQEFYEEVLKRFKTKKEESC